MGGLEIALLCLGFGGVAAFTSLSLFYAQRRAARKAQAGVPVPELEARLQPAGVPLKVHVLTDAGPSGYGTRIVVDGVCGRLTLRRDLPRWSAATAGAPPAPELETGDLDFDAQFFVLGPPTLVHAILDAETRRRLTALTAYQPPGDAAVEHGRLCVDLPLSYGLHPQAVEERGRQAVELARRLLEPKDLARRLSENSQHDPVAAVRLLNLSAAIREDPNNPMTRAALRAAASDRDPQIRLHAALALGPDGRDTLLSLVENDSVDDTIVETAIEALGEVPGVLLGRVLRRAVGVALDSPPAQPRTALACVKALARSRPPEAVSRLQALLLANPFLAEDTARALGDIGGADAESALMGALDGEVAETRLAAAIVLRDVGTTAAVAALHDAERHGGELRRLARQAIAEIQSRASAVPGAVSLAGGEAGQVSMTDDPAGQVSLPPERDG
jgi:hypothetical protein